MPSLFKKRVVKNSCFGWVSLVLSSSWHVAMGLAPAHTDQPSRVAAVTCQQQRAAAEQAIK